MCLIGADHFLKDMQSKGPWNRGERESRYVMVSGNELGVALCMAVCVGLSGSSFYREYFKAGMCSVQVILGDDL